MADQSTRFDHLIVGGGMAADAAARAIHEADGNASVGILGDESDPPFPRPPLSKDLWLDDDTTVENSDFGTPDVEGVTVRTGTRVTAIDPGGHTVTTDTGEEIGYSSLLLATGGRPRTIDGLEPGPRVIYYRRLADYRALRDVATDGARIVVVGGGYIGSEIAAAVNQQGCQVTILHPDEVLGGSMFPEPLARRFEQAFTDKGVIVEGGVKVDGGSASADGVVVRTEEGSEVAADAVVLGLGIEPAGELLADHTDLADDGSVEVDEFLATGVESVFAAGDVATYPDPVLGRTRVEHEDNAVSMGKAAGQLMTGSRTAYEHTPMFYSDVFDLGFEAVGTLDASLTTVVEEKDDGAAIVYYVDDAKLVGVLLWNADADIDDAIELIGRGETYSDPESLKGSLD